jgi:hypothetical protein
MVPSPFESLIHTILEALYAYRTSPYYTLHLIFILALGFLILYLFAREWRYGKRAYSFDSSRGHKVKDSSEWAMAREEETEEAVQKLRESEAYRNYLEDRTRPNSHYSRKIEVEEIVFSDE